jgi:hypothetical protein
MFDQFQQAIAAIAVISAAGILTTYASAAPIFDPPGSGEPTTGTANGGSRPTRNACAPSTQLIAIAAPPESRFTATAQPTIWVYLPKTKAKTLEFSIFDAQQNGVYQTEIAIANRSGLISIPLPPLTPQQHSWTVALVCNPEERTNDWIVSGWIEPRLLNASLQQQLQQANPIEQIELYAKAGFWYDAVHAYLTLRQAQPNHPQLAELRRTLFYPSDRISRW